VSTQSENEPHEAHSTSGEVARPLARGAPRGSAFDAPRAAAPEAPAAASDGPRSAPAHGARRRRRALGFSAIVCSLMMLASLIMVVWNLQEGSLDNAYTGSRYATIESLVDYGTYYIDHSRYVRTIDKMKVGDHYISSKPPLLGTIGAGVYWVYEHLTGKTIARYEGDVVRTVSFWMGAVPHLIFLIYFYRLCRLLFRRQLSVMVGMAGACFAYLGVGYATLINNHSPAATLTICGLYYAARIRLERDVKAYHWPLAGLILGVLPAIDPPGLAIMAALSVYLFMYDRRKTLTWFLPALLPGVLLHFVLAYQITGSLKLFYFNKELKAFKGFYFKNAGGIDGLKEPKYIYAFNTLLGHHGLFSMTPLYVFGLYELIRSIKVRRLLGVSLVCAVTILGFLGFFIFRTRNYGGWCVGMRWFVPIMPLLLLYFGLWVDRVRLSRPLWTAVLLAFGVSCFNVQDALSCPLQYSVWHNWLENAPNRARVGKTFNLPKPRTPRPKPKAKPPKAPRPPAVPVPAAPAVPPASPPGAGAQPAQPAPAP
jgi:hypothetical protein